jgi:hypothetical protein
MCVQLFAIPQQEPAPVIRLARNQQGAKMETLPKFVSSMSGVTSQYGIREFTITRIQLRIASQ